MLQDINDWSEELECANTSWPHPRGNGLPVPFRLSTSKGNLCPGSVSLPYEDRERILVYKGDYVSLLPAAWGSA